MFAELTNLIRLHISEEWCKSKRVFKTYFIAHHLLWSLTPPHIHLHLFPFSHT
jgi:hypothetical protein